MGGANSRPAINPASRPDDSSARAGPKCKPQRQRRQREGSGPSCRRSRQRHQSGREPRGRSRVVADDPDVVESRQVVIPVEGRVPHLREEQEEDAAEQGEADGIAPHEIGGREKPTRKMHHRQGEEDMNGPDSCGSCRNLRNRGERDSPHHDKGEYGRGNRRRPGQADGPNRFHKARSQGDQDGHDFHPQDRQRVGSCNNRPRLRIVRRPGESGKNDRGEPDRQCQSLPPKASSHARSIAVAAA